MTSLRTLALVLTLCATSSLFAQSDPYKPISKLPMGDMILTLPSPNVAGPGTWDVRFTHRFNQSLSEGSFSDQLHTLFGLDTNADVTFAFGYVVRRNLHLSAARSNTNDNFELAAKWVFLQQAPAVPLSITFRGGADIRTEKDLEDRSSLFAQAILSRQFGRKVEVFAVPTVVTNAGRATNGEISEALFDHAFNVPVGVAWMMRPNLALVAEIVPPNTDLPDDFGSDLGWSLGIKRAIGGHWFEILVTNSQATTADQYVTTTFQGAPLDASDIRLGFNIERRFGRRR